MVERVFKAKDRTGQDCEFELKRPGYGEENEGERQYRIAYSNCLVAGIFPREKIREIMRLHGMWTDSDDIELKKVVGKIALLQIELRRLESEGNQDGCVKSARDITEVRRRMWELFLVQQSVYMNSAEGVSEMVKTESIMAACTLVKSTGKRYWETYADYVRERDFNTHSTVYSRVIEVQAALLDEARETLTNDYPENKYLKSTEDRIIDREIQEQVVKELKTRAEKALDAEQPKIKNTRKKRGKPVES